MYSRTDGAPFHPAAELVGRIGEGACHRTIFELSGTGGDHLVEALQEGGPALDDVQVRRRREPAGDHERRGVELEQRPLVAHVVPEHLGDGVGDQVEMTWWLVRGSWLNLVERWFSALTTKKLRRSAHTSVKDLAADITAWVDRWNQNPTPIIWHRTADEILTKLANYCATITTTS